MSLQYNAEVPACINLSFFLSYFNKLYLVDKDNIDKEMTERFIRLDAQLAEIRRQIKA